MATVHEIVKNIPWLREVADHAVDWIDLAPHFRFIVLSGTAYR